MRSWTTDKGVSLQHKNQVVKPQYSSSFRYQKSTVQIPSSVNYWKDENKENEAANFYQSQ